MVEWWVAVALAVVTAALGYLGHFVQAKIGTKDNQDNVAAQERKRADETFRWAAELSVDKDERKKALGVAQLKLISEDPALTEAEADRVTAAIDVALASTVAAWETEETPQREGDET